MPAASHDTGKPELSGSESFLIGAMEPQQQDGSGPGVCCLDKDDLLGSSVLSLHGS